MEAQPSPSELLTDRQFAIAYGEGFSQTVRFLCSTGVAGDLAEEVAQAAWMRGWECRGQLRNPGALRLWINSIALNLARLGYRRRRTTEELAETSAVQVPSLAGQMAEEILSHCTAEDRALLVQYYMMGYSSTELAAGMGISAVSVRVRLLRIKKTLRRSLRFRRERLVFEDVDAVETPQSLPPGFVADQMGALHGGAGPGRMSGV